MSSGRGSTGSRSPAARVEATREDIVRLASEFIDTELAAARDRPEPAESSVADTTRRGSSGRFPSGRDRGSVLSVMTTTETPSRTTRRPRRRISGLEIAAGGLYVLVLLVLVAIEPDILQAPFESPRAILVTFGGLALGLFALLAMIRFGVPPIVRVLVIGIPVLIVSWWLIEPFFVDDVVEETFSTSISEQQSSAPAPSAAATPADPATTATTAAPVPAGPQLIGSGSFVGLTGHDGTGDAGIFRLEDGSLVLRLENFDIDNGPDLELYLVPGKESYSPGGGSLHLGALKGNVGNQTYEIPRDFALTPGPWTVLVWCEAFTVEFVGASLTIS